jgi:hypothetical protein
MRRLHREERFAEDLQEVADALSDSRPVLDPLALDRVKLRAMSAARRSAAPRDKGYSMRSRLTTLLAAAFLVLGTGGALAGSDGGGSSGGSASISQYRCPTGHSGRHCREVEREERAHEREELKKSKELERKERAREREELKKSKELERKHAKEQRQKEHEEHEHKGKKGH